MASYDDHLPSQPSEGGGGLYEHDDSRRPHPTHHSSLPNEGRTRPRGLSNPPIDIHNQDTTRFQQARQPINDAVQSAFTNANAATTAGLHPDLLQQITSEITANVLSQLKASNLALSNSQPSLSASQMDASSSTAGSPPLDRATVYTPPSPYRGSEDLGQPQPSPQFPPPPDPSSIRAASPPTEKRSVSPFSHAGNLSENDGTHERLGRPKGPKRISTSGDATILERVWGTLFDEQGEATQRFGQFLRGIAVHLIEDYEPKQSLVITPSKMQQYYEETKLSTEFYPWKIIFDDRTSSISRMFRDIEAQHHLIQDKLDERPDIPGLTPQGFQTWATLLLKAHPDQEFERLAKTALEMPISNPDDKKERFPKELSRRMFPKFPDAAIASRLQKAMSTHCNVTFTSRQSSVAEPRSQSLSSNQPSDEAASKSTLRPPADSQDSGINGAPLSPALSHTSLERQRQPYTGVPAVSATEFMDHGPAIDEEDNMPTPQPIERERKPYVAAPGAGKNYDNLDDPVSTPDISAQAAQAPQPPQPEVKIARSGSMHSNTRPSIAQSRAPPVAVHQRPPPPPLESYEGRPQRSNNLYHRDHPRRTRSPSAAKDNGDVPYMRRSESDMPYQPPSHYPSNPNDPFEEARRYKDWESHRERLANDRYDAARMSAYDPRERDRERGTRPRMQSVSDFDGPPRIPHNGHIDEDYYRDKSYPGNAGGHHIPPPISTGFHPPPVHSASANSREALYGSYPLSARYPPNIYKDLP